MVNLVQHIIVLLLMLHSNMYVFIVHVEKAKTAKEEARELLLNEETAIRHRVKLIQKNLSVMLRTLGQMAIANPIFTHGQLPTLVSDCICLTFFCLPTSRLLIGTLKVLFVVIYQLN